MVHDTVKLTGIDYSISIFARVMVRVSGVTLLKCTWRLDSVDWEECTWRRREIQDCKRNGNTETEGRTRGRKAKEEWRHH